MFTEQIRAAIAVSPRDKLADLSAAVWKGYAAGAINEVDAQSLADLIEARKVVPAPQPKPRRTVGSRPRTSESLERRRRWVSSGLMPPQIASQFTMGEAAALAVIALEAGKKGSCKLTLGHIAALAGVCKSTVRNAVRQAEALGLVRNDEWRLSAYRSAPNTVTIVSAEWTTWLRMVVRKAKGGGGSKLANPTTTNQNRRKGEAYASESSGFRSTGNGLWRPKTRPPATMVAKTL